MDCLRHCLSELGLFVTAYVRRQRVKVERWHLLRFRWRNLQASADRLQLIISVEGEPLVIGQLQKLALVRVLLVKVLLYANCLDVLQLFVIDLQDGKTFFLHQVHEIQNLLLAALVVILLFLLDAYCLGQLLVLCHQQFVLLLRIFQSLRELLDARELSHAAHGCLAWRGDLGNFFTFPHRVELH